MHVIMENIRCFKGKHTVGIHPLTLLVGENSSGKSTFLAILSSILNSSKFPMNPGFNDSPYSLGGFENIATYNVKEKLSDKYFRIGFQITGNEIREIVGTYISSSGSARLSHFESKSAGISFEFDFTDKKISGKIEKSGESYPFSFEKNKYPISSYLDLLGVGFVSSIDSRKKGPENFVKNILNSMSSLSTAISDELGTVYSLSPIRTKPNRTYNQFDDTFHPEGDHIPLKLARFLLNKSKDKKKRTAINALKEFGADSGLFSEVSPQRLGNKADSPIQLIITMGDHQVNLTDVGYGVSQSLSVIVEGVIDSPDNLLLIQQPEVHLHPKAQAALGTFFTKMVAKSNSRFVIETHSDYLIDRIRQEISHGTINHEDVKILFFDKSGHYTNIHSISLDENGNIVNAPQSYREFFIEEEIKLLTRV